MGNGTLKFKHNGTIYSLINDIYRRYLYPTFKDNVAVLRIYFFTSAGEGDASHCNVYASSEQGSKILVGSGSANERIYINNSSPTVHFKKNNKIYHCAKSFTLVDQRVVSYNSNGGTGSMDSQTFYPDDGESVTIKANTFTRSGYSFVSWNTSSDGSGTTYSSGAKFSGNSLSLFAQWKINFSASGWAAAYSSSNTWQETNLGDWKVYKHTQHFYNFTVKVTAPSSNVYDFIIVSNTGNWTAELVSNPDISMNGSTTKTMSVLVRFKSTLQSGDPVAHLTIGLRDRTNSVNTVVSQYSFSTALSFGTTDSEE